MSLLRNLALMGTSTVMRLGFGMLTFVVMARRLGPEAFGTLMLWLSVATLLSLLANYGLAPYLLRAIGASPGTARATMAEVLSAKLLLSLGSVLLATALMPWIGPAARTVFVLLLLAQLAESLTEFYNVGYRATNRFADETRLASVTVALQFAIVTATLWWLPTLIAAACAFLASRLVVLFLTAMSQRRYFAGLKPAPLAAAWRCVVTTRSYAIDFGLQSLLGQVDSVVLNHFVGPVAVGLYQAGMRLFNGGAQAARILANVFLPRAAAVSADSGRLRAESLRVQWAFVGVGIAFGFVLAAFPEIIVRLLFGAEYMALAALLPWFGLLFFVRFVASSWGVLLTSVGEQGFRAWTNAAQWILVAVVTPWLVPRHGAVGWLIALIVGNAMLTVSYVARGQRICGIDWRQTFATVAALCGFIPFLHLPSH